uniref:Uncharacterized protein n=1 Tax=Eutreptiella gymnastica TaxID=73025 RepID=A0A7S4G288_9EUGL
MHVNHITAKTAPDGGAMAQHSTARLRKVAHQTWCLHLNLSTREWPVCPWYSPRGRFGCVQSACLLASMGLPLSWSLGESLCCAVLLLVEPVQQPPVMFGTSVHRLSQ